MALYGISILLAKAPRAKRLRYFSIMNSLDSNEGISHSTHHKLKHGFSRQDRKVQIWTLLIQESYCPRAISYDCWNSYFRLSKCFRRPNRFYLPGPHDCITGGFQERGSETGHCGVVLIGQDSAGVPRENTVRKIAHEHLSRD
jgi:hypothetical protein